jgi:signal transduction histidine kinase/CheY-like chemotaxis protein
MKMSFVRYLFLLVLFTFSVTGMARNGNSDEVSYSSITLTIDSLEHLLDRAQPQEKLALMLKLAELYQTIDPETGAVYAHKAIGLKDYAPDTVNVSTAFYLLSDFHHARNQFDSAYIYKQLAMEELAMESKLENKSLLAHRLHSLQSEGGTSNFFLVVLGIVLLLLLALLVIAVLFFRFYLKHKKLKIQFLESKREFDSRSKEIARFKIKVEEAVKAEIIELSAELEKARLDEIELRKQLKHVEEADYLKNAFLGSLSHEIRTPLSGIVGFTSLLQTELAVLGNSELYEYTYSIEQSSQQLTSLLNNIVDISSIEANMVEVELQLDRFNNIVKEVQETYSQRAKEKGLVFKVKIDPELPKLKADSIKLKKVLHILVDNAVKFTEKGFVTITTAYNPERNIAVIQTRDTGIGIDAETLRLLLSSFQYGQHDATKIYQGKGIGLTLAYRFVSMMGGSLSISSPQGEGTTVTIAIPCVGSASTEVKPTELSVESLSFSPDQGPISLFIVEDDRMNRMVLEKMLRHVGNITLAVDGDDAMTKIEKAYKKKVLFDVMLFDMQLPPPWDGISLMQKVKEVMPEYKSVPFIVQTAFAMGGDKDRYLDAGFDDYIAKPIDKTELMTMVKRNLAFHRGK